MSFSSYKVGSISTCNSSSCKWGNPWPLAPVKDVDSPSKVQLAFVSLTPTKRDTSMKPVSQESGLNALHPALAICFSLTGIHLSWSTGWGHVSMGEEAGLGITAGSANVGLPRRPPEHSWRKWPLPPTQGTSIGLIQPSLSATRSAGLPFPSFSYFWLTLLSVTAYSEGVTDTVWPIIFLGNTRKPVTLCSDPDSQFGCQKNKTKQQN